jgi:membrane protease YdiL (CAAX protease family)
MRGEGKAMLSKSGSRIVKTLLVGVLIFVVSIVIPKLLVSKGGASLLTTQGLELALALLAIAILDKGRFSDYGFRLPRVARFSLWVLVKWVLIALAAMGMGAIATLAVSLSGGSGNPVVKQLSFPQIVLFVWVFSSIIEEILTRGFIQGHLSPLNEVGVGMLVFRVSVPTLAGALFFAAMHLVLLLSGADIPTTVIIVIFTFSLGLLAGHQRAKSGSLIPAIILHALANVGGMLGGIVFVLIAIVTTGRLPEL